MNRENDGNSSYCLIWALSRIDFWTGIWTSCPEGRCDERSTKSVCLNRPHSHYHNIYSKLHCNIFFIYLLVFHVTIWNSLHCQNFCKYFPHSTNVSGISHVSFMNVASLITVKTNIVSWNKPYRLLKNHYIVIIHHYHPILFSVRGHVPMKVHNWLMWGSVIFST